MSPLATLAPALLGLMAAGPVDDPGDKRPADVTLIATFAAGKPEATLPLDFRVENDSARPIRIIDHRVSCGCVALADAPESIAPGGSGVVRCTIATHRLRGRVEQSLILKTDHPTRPIVRLVIRGTIESTFADPEVVDFGTVRHGDAATRTVLVLAAGLDRARIVGVSVDDADLVSASLGPPPVDSDREHAIEPLGVVTMTWKGGQDASPGGRATALLIRTTDPRTPVLRLPVTAHVSGTSRVSPPRLLFGSVAAGRRAEVSCEVALDLGAGSAPGRIEVAADGGLVRASVASIDPSGRIRLVAVADRSGPAHGPAPTGLVRGRIDGTSDGRALFSVPYLVYFPEEARGAARSEPTRPAGGP